VEENKMKLNDERRKVLTKYLGLCWHEGRMPINCGYRCVKCGDTYVANRTFDNDADMMALFREMVDRSDALKIMEKDDAWFSFCKWALWRRTCWSAEDYEEITKFLFYKPERFCNLVAEWLEVKK
jgi:hypothetical protein